MDKIVIARTGLGTLLMALVPTLAAPALAAQAVQQPDMWVRLSKPPAVAPGGETHATVTWSCQANSAAAEGRSMVHEKVEVWAPRGTEFDTKRMRSQPGSWWSSGDAHHMVVQSVVDTMCWRPGDPSNPNPKYQQQVYLRVLRTAVPGSVLHDLTARITEDYGIQDDNLANDRSAVPVTVAGVRPRPTPRPTVPSLAASPTASPTPTQASPSATAGVAPVQADSRGKHVGAMTATGAGAATLLAAGTGTFLVRRRRVRQR